METIRFTAELPPVQTVSAESIGIELEESPGRYYRHGWQSWSLAAWTDTSRALPVQKPYLLHPMQHDPAYSFSPRPHGSWLGAVQTQEGEVLLLGSLGLDAQVQLNGDRLEGQYETGRGEWFIARGEERKVFGQYADQLGKRLGRARSVPAPRVWCSWYGLYTAIDEDILARIFRGLDGLPFDVLQVDDGWQRSIGDWEPNSKFRSGMQALSQEIRSTGRRAGLWLAPFIAARSSQLFREHPGWFLRGTAGRLVSAGFNWGEQLYALDTTNPPVLEWLRGLMEQVRSWGFDYLKLDFLYGAALPGERQGQLGREAAYRQGMETLRKGMGEDAYFVACGAPIIPSLGICNALRTGPDVSGEWENERDAILLHNPSIPGTRNAIRTTLHRLWLAPLVRPDPDVVYFRSIECSLTSEQKILLQKLAQICGFKATSDLPEWLSPAERDSLRDFLERSPQVEQTGPRDYRIDGNLLDFSEAIELAQPPAGWDRLRSAMLGWLANHTWALRLDYAGQRQALKKLRKRLEEGK